MANQLGRRPAQIAIWVASLALYAPLPPTARDHPTFGVLPVAARQLFERRYPDLVAAQAEDIADFRRSARFGRTERLLRARHYVFLTQPDDTYARTMSFLQQFAGQQGKDGSSPVPTHSAGITAGSVFVGMKRRRGLALRLQYLQRVA